MLFSTTDKSSHKWMCLVVLKAWEKLSPNSDHLSRVPLVLVNNFLFSLILLGSSTPASPSTTLHSNQVVVAQQRSLLGSWIKVIPHFSHRFPQFLGFLSSSWATFFPATLAQLSQKILLLSLSLLSLPNCSPLPPLPCFWENAPNLAARQERRELFRPFCHGERKL